MSIGHSESVIEVGADVAQLHDSEFVIVLRVE